MAAPLLTAPASAAGTGGSPEIFPALVMQDGRRYLYHSAADTADQIDPCRVSGAAGTLVEHREEAGNIWTDPQL